MNKDKGAASCIKRGFPISCVWFGAIVGPSLLSGVYAPVYLSPYGAWAVVLPIIMEIPICILAAMSAGIVAKHKTYDYASLGKVVYGRWFKYMIVFLDYYIILSFIIGGASVATIEGSIGAQAFGCSEFVGAWIFGIVTVIIMVSGERIMRLFSTIAMPIMTVGFLTLAVIVISGANGSITEILGSRWQTYEGYKLSTGIWRILVLGMSNLSTTFGSLCAIEQRLRDGKDAAAFGFCSLVMNSFLFITLALMILPYGEGILSEAQPTVWIINNVLVEKFPWLPEAYMWFMFLVLLTSDVPQCNAICARLTHKAAVKYGWDVDGSSKKRKLFMFALGIVYEGVCIGVGQFGLTRIVSIGYSFSGVLGIMCCAVPVLLYFIKRIFKKTDLQNM